MLDEQIERGLSLAQTAMKAIHASIKSLDGVIAPRDSGGSSTSWDRRWGFDPISAACEHLARVSGLIERGLNVGSRHPVTQRNVDRGGRETSRALSEVSVSASLARCVIAFRMSANRRDNEWLRSQVNVRPKIFWIK